MKTFLVSCFASTFLVLGVSQAQQWAKWDFSSDFENGELVATDGSQLSSLLRISPVSDALIISPAGMLICAQTGPTDFVTVDIDDLTENGGGSYVNEYTLVFDIRVEEPSWLPVYNTGYDNGDAAEIWISPDGAVGGGGDYTSSGIIQQGKWCRLVLRRSNLWGSWQTDIFVDGIIEGIAHLDDLLDGQSSLYTNGRQDDGQFTILSDGDDNIYGGCVLGGFQFYDRALSSEEIADMGSYDYKVRAYDPSPESGAANVPVDVQLSWSAAVDPDNSDQIHPAIAKHYIFLDSGEGIDSDLNLVGTLDAGEPTVFTVQLERDRTYIWRVDGGVGDAAAGDPNNIIGERWSFSTVSTSPVIAEISPVNVYGYPGETVILTVEAMNPFTNDTTGMGYQWYKYIDGINDVKVGVDSATHTVVNIGLSDAGQYYCEVTVISNSHKTVSSPVKLVVKRLIHNWKFNDDASDSVGGVDGVVTGNPKWVQGKEGNAIELDPDDGMEDFVTLGTAEDIKFGSRDDFSVSVWVKSNGSPSYGAIISNKDWNRNANTGWGIFDYQGPIDWNISDGTVYGDMFIPDIYDGRWHNITATNDRYGDATIYLDGDGRNIASVFIGDMIGTIDTEMAVRIGQDGREQYPFKGVIDDVRIYNYALDSIEVGLVYTELNPGTDACSGEVEFDLNNNCVVDIADLALIVESWLECNIVPTCIP